MRSNIIFINTFLFWICFIFLAKTGQCKRRRFGHSDIPFIFHCNVRNHLALEYMLCDFVYKSLKQDLTILAAELMQNPDMGTDLGNGLHKVGNLYCNAKICSPCVGICCGIGTERNFLDSFLVQIDVLCASTHC